jgi:hypothetical protein
LGERIDIVHFNLLPTTNLVAFTVKEQVALLTDEAFWVLKVFFIKLKLTTFMKAFPAQSPNFRSIGQIIGLLEPIFIGVEP